MMATLLEGKTVSEKILNSLPDLVDKVKSARNRPPSLAVINYFENSPSAIYVKRKIKTCEKLGINVKIFTPENASDYGGFLKLLADIGKNPDFDALMIEKPLPDGFEKMSTWEAVPASKDVDGLSALNAGRLFLCKSFIEIENGNFFVPCTAMAVVKILKHYGIRTESAKIAVIGRSAVVGKPLAHMLTCMNATVTLCHSRTPDISSVLKQSDIIISAVGKARWIGMEMLKQGTIVVDVGTNIDGNGKMCGDVDFEAVKDKAEAITPVPGGVGPVTLAGLIENAVKAAQTAVTSGQ
ncbi:MAG: bifunctional 5,10-methylenetetrahydrofolate dehydrogenase/5,10-methenyltetrahydrofolate cyclohydrolase [Elusimicrobia bacterium]|nr:bifunctional 5,10-methylenetetrahydrofolate dehydrogenase/5,10-methenyltetrahydrofolate cyclohydrolase [Elusimicrobiota bacterium]